MAMPFTTGENPAKTTGSSSLADSSPVTDATRAMGSARVIGSAKVQTEPSATKKRAAMAVAVILLLALVASAYFVLRKPSINTSQDVATSTQAQNLTPPPSSDTQPNANASSLEAAKTDAEREAFEREKEKLEREKKALEKKEQALAEKDAKEEQPKEQPAKQEPTPPPPTPVEPSSPAQASGETACAGVRVVGPEGQPLSGIRVMFVGSTGTDTRRTGPNGLCSVCGLTIGSRVKIMVFAKGIPATRELTIRPGQNGTEVRLDRPEQFGPRVRPEPPPQVDNEPGQPGFRRGNKPFRKRPNY
jgi:hypothetical protein